MNLSLKYDDVISNFDLDTHCKRKLTSAIIKDDQCLK